MIPDKLFLVGFSGSGKTTVGKLLAKKLRYQFVDTDAVIVHRAKMAVPRIFASKGERYFRSLESQVIGDICRRKNRQVVSLGGGSFLKQKNRQLVLQSGLTIYLRCSLDQLVKRTIGDSNRPLIKAATAETKSESRARIQKLLIQRLPGYRMADILLVTTDRTSKQAAAQLYSCLKIRYDND